MNTEIVVDYKRIKGSNELVVSSLEVAKKFGKRHANILRAIDNLRKKYMEKDILNFENIFFPVLYLDSYGREQQALEMTVSGFRILAYSFTGLKALEWKLRYEEAFSSMEEKLRKKEAKTIPVFDENSTQCIYMKGIEQQCAIATMCGWGDGYKKGIALEADARFLLDTGNHLLSKILIDDATKVTSEILLSYDHSTAKEAVLITKGSKAWTIQNIANNFDVPSTVISGALTEYGYAIRASRGNFAPTEKGKSFCSTRIAVSGPYKGKELCSAWLFEQAGALRSDIQKHVAAYTKMINGNDKLS